MKAVSSGLFLVQFVEGEEKERANVFLLKLGKRGMVCEKGSGQKNWTRVMHAYVDSESRGIKSLKGTHVGLQSQLS